MLRLFRGALCSLIRLSSPSGRLCGIFVFFRLLRSLCCGFCLACSILFRLFDMVKGGRFKRLRSFRSRVWNIRSWMLRLFRRALCSLIRLSSPCPSGRLCGIFFFFRLLRSLCCSFCLACSILFRLFDMMKGGRRRRCKIRRLRRQLLVISAFSITEQLQQL